MKIDKEKRDWYLDYIFFEYGRAVERIEKLKQYKAEYGEDRLYKKLEEEVHHYESILSEIIRTEMGII